MPAVDWNRFEAVLFDLDGVLTDTARLHARAWKDTFEAFFEELHPGQPPFDLDRDYRRYVDGRPRYEGVATFLDSRGISLPRGDREDRPDQLTICGLGNRKNEVVGRLLDSQGVDVYRGSRRLLEYLRDRSIALAVVTSSANGANVLERAGLTAFFDVRVDGQLAAELGLKGKPHPDPFLKAAEMLGVEPTKAVVIEDATSGVAAGRAGRFGLVIGVSRHDDAAALTEAGADLVVEDLGALIG